MKKLLTFALLLIVIFIASIFYQPKIFTDKPFTDTSYYTDIVRVGDKTFTALVSDTDVLRTKGLSGRMGLKNDQAMLFIFNNSGIWGFWMKDMLFSIDILWLDEQFHVVSFEENISPHTYPKIFYPKSPAKYVVELASGTLNDLGVKIDDRVLISSGK